MRSERESCEQTPAGEETEVGCFVSDGYREDCERFIEELKKRLAGRLTDSLVRA